MDQRQYRRCSCLPVHRSLHRLTKRCGHGVGGFTLNTQLEFVDATGSWGTIQSLGIWDASTGGNLLVFDDLAATKVIESGDTFRFNIGAIVINIS